MVHKKDIILIKKELYKILRVFIDKNNLDNNIYKQNRLLTLLEQLKNDVGYFGNFNKQYEELKAMSYSKNKNLTKLTTKDECKKVLSELAEKTLKLQNKELSKKIKLKDKKTVEELLSDEELKDWNNDYQKDVQDDYYDDEDEDDYYDEEDEDYDDEEDEIDEDELINSLLEE